MVVYPFAPCQLSNLTGFTDRRELELTREKNVPLFGSCRCQINKRFDVLQWVIRRKEAFAFLLNDMESTSGSKEMTQTELQMLVSIASSDTPDGRKFWGTALVIQVISDWGASVSKWLHSCACSHHQTEKEKQNCCLKGRRAVELSSGVWQDFINVLKSLTGETEWADFLLRCFHDCKSMMEMRCYQCWSFWGEFPYAILQMCQHFIDQSKTEDFSRKKAQELMQNFDSSEQKSELGVPPWFFW